MADRDESVQPGRARWWIATVVLVAAAIFLWLQAGGGPGGRGRGVTLVPEPGAEQQSTSPQLRLEGALDAPLPMRAGDVVHLEAGQLPASGDVALELALAEPSATAEPRPVTVHAGTPLQLAWEGESAPLAGERTAAPVALPVDLIRAPGRYLVTIETTEKMAIPVRRYMLEVH